MSGRVALKNTQPPHLSDRSKYGQSKMGLPNFLRRDSSNHVGAIGKSFLDVESALGVDVVNETDGL